MIENTYSCTVWLIGRAVHQCNLDLACWDFNAYRNR